MPVLCTGSTNQNRSVLYLKPLSVITYIARGWKDDGGEGAGRGRRWWRCGVGGERVESPLLLFKNLLDVIRNKPSC